MKRLLIVDDLIAYLESLSRALRGDYELVCTDSLAEAKISASRVQPDLALVDVRLSEYDEHNLDGLTLLSWLRSTYPDMPILMMSAYRDFDAAVASLNLGADRFLTKPIDLKELRETLRSLAEHGRSGDTGQAPGEIQ